MSRLLPCPECRRHVRADEPSCPFCRARIPATGDDAAAGGVLVPPSVGKAAQRSRAGRIAVLAAGATLMGAPVGCSTATTKPDASVDQTSSGSGGNTGSGGASLDGAIEGGGSGGRDGGAEAPIAIYAAAVALPRNQA